MIIIGEKINGAIPSIGEAIRNKDSDLIRQRASDQDLAGADYIDCAPSTVPGIEYETMCWMLEEIQAVSEKPVCIDSPNARLLARILEEERVKKPGMINSVNEESDKCEIIFPMIAGSEWHVVGMTCDKEGIPLDAEKKIDIAKRIIDKAVSFGVALNQVHIDPCVMALSTLPDAMLNFETCIRGIHAYAPEVKVTGAISNISYSMPARKYVNSNCIALAMQAGLDSAIVDPMDIDLMSTIYACEALLGRDKAGRKYNRAYRAGKLGIAKNRNRM